MDSSDGGPALTLFTSQFYRNCKTILKEKGILVVNMDSAVLENTAVQEKTLTIETAFSHCHLFQVRIHPFFLWFFYVNLFLIEIPKKYQLFVAEFKTNTT